MKYELHIDYSPDLEKIVIGACLLEVSAIGRIYNLIKPEHFYSFETKNSAKAIWQMFENGIPIDLTTVIHFLSNNMGLHSLDGLKSNKEFSDIPYLLASFTIPVTGTAHLEYHCHILKQMFLNREIKRIKSGQDNLSGNPKDDLKALYNQLEKLRENTTDEGWQDMSELMVSLYKHQDEMSLTKGRGLQTGFKLLDNLNGGFFPGQMIVLGARPSIGKSAFAGQIALNTAKLGNKVGIISLEMNNNEISARLAAIDTQTDFGVIYRNLFRDEREKDIFYNRVNNHTSKLPIFITDKTNVNINDIRAKATSLKARHGLDILILDYLQLVNAEGGKNKNRENEVSEMSRGVKIMAKELNVPVLVLCQLNRASTHRKGEERYPMLSDLRESGSIEQDADVVMFLHRDWPMGFLTDAGGNSTEFDGDLLIRKWRNGKLAHIKLDFIGSRMMFQEKRGEGFKPMMPETNNYQDDNPF